MISLKWMTRVQVLRRTEVYFTLHLLSGCSYSWVAERRLRLCYSVEPKSSSLTHGNFAHFTQLETSLFRKPSSYCTIHDNCVTKWPVNVNSKRISVSSWHQNLFCGKGRWHESRSVKYIIRKCESINFHNAQVQGDRLVQKGCTLFLLGVRVDAVDLDDRRALC